MGIILQMSRQAFQKIFRPKKPSATVKPNRIKGNQQADSSPDKQTSKRETGGEKDRFWRDKIESDASEPKQKFYLKHRERLETQDPDITRDR